MADEQTPAAPAPMAEAAVKDKGKKAEPAKKGGGPNPIFIISLSLVGATVASAALLFLVVVPKLNSARDPHRKQVQVAEASMGPTVAVKDLVINSADTDDIHYFKIGLALEVGDKKKVEEVTARDAQIRDLVISEFSAHTVTEASTPKGREVVRQELLKKLNEKMGGEVLRNIFFTEYVAQ
jgi:flagellar FliL protein